MNIILIALALCALCVLVFIVSLFLDDISKKMGRKNKVYAVIKGKKLEAQDYSFTPSEADIESMGNNLIYRLYVEVSGKKYDVLTSPRVFKEIKVGNTIEVWLYQGFFGRKFVDLT